MTKMLPQAKLLTVSLALVGIAALSGCTAGPAPEATPTEAPPQYSEESLAAFLEYTGATAGEADDSLDTIHIGNVNQETGVGALPDLTKYLEGAVELINTQLGGVGGRPVELTTCDVTSPETGLSCAQQFANDPTILAVVQNSISKGSDAFHSVMDASGIPVVSALPQTPKDGAAPNSYFTSSGTFSAPGAIGALIKQTFQGQSLAIIVPDGDPVSAQVAATLAGRLGPAGITVTQASFSSTDTDPTAALLAAGVGDADVILPAVVTPQACLSVAKALDALGTDTPVIALPTCTSNVVKEALGDLPQWVYLYNFVNPDAPSEDALTTTQIEAYQQWYAPLELETVGVIGLQVGLTLQRHLIAGGAEEATRESIAAAAKAWTGPIFLGPSEVAYGKPPFAGVPTFAGMLAYTYEGDGEWASEVDGKWLGATP